MKRIGYPKAPVYVQEWPEGTELCETCGQPDNCGDCNHQPLDTDGVLYLGGTFVPATVMRLPGESLASAVDHVLRYGKLGKQSRRRLKEARQS